MSTGASVDSAPVDQPLTLDHLAIAARIPHQGRMCLLDRLCSWSAKQIHCSASSHRDHDNPLRTAGGLLAPCAIEYAAQAMALHGSLLAASADPPRAGYIAALREVRFAVPNLHAVAGDLQIFAERLAGDASVVSYFFHVDDVSGQRLAEGRATVVLNPPEAA